MSTFDFETNFESAAKIFLKNATGLTATSIFSSLDQDNFVIPRLQISATMNGATDPPTLNDSGNLEYSQYDMDFSISIVTDASIDGSHTDHRLYRAQVREAMLLNADNWSTIAVGGGTVLPLYQVKYQRPSGTDYEVDGMLAVSTLSYELKFTVNNAAPAAIESPLASSTTATSSTCATIGSSSYSNLDTYTFATFDSSSYSSQSTGSFTVSSSTGTSTSYGSTVPTTFSNFSTSFTSSVNTSYSSSVTQSYVTSSLADATDYTSTASYATSSTGQSSFSSYNTYSTHCANT